MKKLTYLFIILIGLFALSGCGLWLTDEERRENLKNVVDALSAEKTLAKYLSNVQFEKDEEADHINLFYNIRGNLDDSFDDLNSTEQHAFFSEVTNVIRESNKENLGTLSCDDYYFCYIWEVRFSTSKGPYDMKYDPFERDIVTFEDMFGQKYGPNGYIPDENATDSSPSTGASIVDGYDWENLDYFQKGEIVSTVISNLESQVGLWDALNAFYGDEATNSTKVVEAMVLSGVGGQVIITP
jgi:hypothetical protein